MYICICIYKYVYICVKPRLSSASCESGFSALLVPVMVAPTPMVPLLWSSSHAHILVRKTPSDLTELHDVLIIRGRVSRQDCVRVLDVHEHRRNASFHLKSVCTNLSPHSFFNSCDLCQCTREPFIVEIQHKPAVDVEAHIWVPRRSLNMSSIGGVP